MLSRIDTYLFKNSIKAMRAAFEKIKDTMPEATYAECAVEIDRVDDELDAMDKVLARDEDNKKSV